MQLPMTVARVMIKASIPNVASPYNICRLLPTSIHNKNNNIQMSAVMRRRIPGYRFLRNRNPMHMPPNMSPITVNIYFPFLGPKIIVQTLISIILLVNSAYAGLLKR